MAHDEGRSLYDIKRDAERSRMELADTVDTLRASLTGARQRLAPDSLKAEAAEFARQRGARLLDAARANPAQAAAIGALVAWPLTAIVRAIPLPVALIGAGLFLTSTQRGRGMVRSGVDRASDLADEVNRRTHDLRDASGDVVDAAADRVADAAARVSDLAHRAADAAAGATDRATAAAAGVVASARDATHADDALQSTRDAGLRAMDAARDAGLRAMDQARDAGSQARGSAASIVNWAKENPALVGALGLIVGGFVASALPATAAERGVAGVVGAGVRTGLKAAAAQGVAQAAGAAVRAAATQLQPHPQPASGVQDQTQHSGA